MRRATSALNEAPNMREEILEAATRRFAAHGFDGVSLQDIADDVAIKKPSLLYHFASKEQLREEVIAGLLEHWGSVLPRIMSSAMGERRRLDALMHEMVAYFAIAPHRARLLFREMLDRPVDIKKRLSHSLGPWLALLADYIRRGQQDGTVQPDLDADAYLSHVVTAVLASVAVGDVATLYAPRVARERAMERHLRELVRLAKTSLFINPGAQRG
jgi:AcrR family transcriptional regulator